MKSLNDFPHLCGLMIELACRRRGVIGVVRIRLRDGIDLSQCGGDLGEPLALLDRGGGDAVHQDVDLLGLTLNLIKPSCDLTRRLHALLTASRGLADFHRGRMVCRSAALRQCPHFVGHHRKTRSSRARTGSFNRRIQRENIGLKSDLADRFIDGCNFR